MKQYIKFLKFLWVLFIVPVVYGTEVNQQPQFGVVEHSIDKCPNLIEVVDQMLKVSTHSKKEAEGFVKSVLRTFGEHMGPSMNFLLWDGQIYLNGLIPISDFGDSLQIEGVREDPYPVVQLCDMLGYKDIKEKKRLEAARGIAYSFPLLNKSLYWTSISAFLNEAKGKTGVRIDSMLEERREKCEDLEVKYLEAAADYIKSLRSLGIGTKYLRFNKNGLFESFNEAENKTRDLMKGYLNAFGNYISFLDPDDGNSFLEELDRVNNLQKPVSYLVEAYKLWSRPEYNPYTHTEYMVWYQVKRDGLETKPLWVISFLDACLDCERLFARVISKKENSTYKTGFKRRRLDSVKPSTDNEYNVIIISGCDYKERRSNLRFPELINPRVLEIQLSPDFYLTN